MARVPPCLPQEEKKHRAHVLRFKGTVVPGRRHTSQQAQKSPCFLIAGPHLLPTGKVLSSPSLPLHCHPFRPNWYHILQRSPPAPTPLTLLMLKKANVMALRRVI